MNRKIFHVKMIQIVKEIENVQIKFVQEFQIAQQEQDFFNQILQMNNVRLMNKIIYLVYINAC